MRDFRVEMILTSCWSDTRIEKHTVQIPICSSSCLATPSDSSEAFVTECRTGITSASKGPGLLMSLSHLGNRKKDHRLKQIKCRTQKVTKHFFRVNISFLIFMPTLCKANRK